MSISEQDFISIWEAAKRLDISMDQVMFHIQEGRLTGYLECIDTNSISNRFRGSTARPLLPKLFKWKKVELPVECSRNEVRFYETTIFDEHFNFYKKQTSTSHRFPFHCSIDKIMLIAKEVERYERENNVEVLKREPLPSIDEYVQIRRSENVPDEIIAVELCDKNGGYRLTNRAIAKLFGCDRGLNEAQHETLKQRGQRFRNKGIKMLAEQSKTSGG